MGTRQRGSVYTSRQDSVLSVSNTGAGVEPKGREWDAGQKRQQGHGQTPCGCREPEPNRHVCRKVLLSLSLNALESG